MLKLPENLYFVFQSIRSNRRAKPPAKEMKVRFAR